MKYLCVFLFLSASFQASAQVFHFDISSLSCINAEGTPGRNKTLGVCSEHIGMDLSEAQLAGKQLTGSDFSFASLSRTNLEGALLEYSLFNSADLDSAQLLNAKLKGASGNAANFDMANLEDADLRQSKLESASFYNSRLMYANMSESRLDSARLIKADLSNAKLRKANMYLANMTEAKLDYADLSGAYAVSSNFTQAALTGAILRGADLTRSEFKLADLTSVDFRGSNLKGANIEARNLETAYLKDAKFDEKTVLPFPKEKAIEYGMIFEPSGSSVTEQNPRAGEISWHLGFPENGEMRVSVNNSRVFLQHIKTDDQSKIIRLNPSTKTEMWSYTVEGKITSIDKECFNDRSIYLASDSKIFALDARNGNLLWSLSVGSLGKSYGELYCKLDLDRLIHSQKNYDTNKLISTVLSASRGAVLWDLEKDSNARVCGVSALNVYLCDFDTTYAYSSKNGRLRWQFGGSLTGLNTDKPYAKSNDSLRLLDELTGNQKYEISLGSAPSIVYNSGPRLIVVRQKSIEVFDIDSGSFQWSYDLSSQGGIWPEVIHYGHYFALLVKNREANWARILMLDLDKKKFIWEKAYDDFWTGITSHPSFGLMVTDAEKAELLDNETGKSIFSYRHQHKTTRYQHPHFHIIAREHGNYYLNLFDMPPARLVELNLFAIREKDGAELWNKNFGYARYITWVPGSQALVEYFSPGSWRDSYVEILEK